MTAEGPPLEDLREWIAYLRDIGVRELHAPRARPPSAASQRDAAAPASRRRRVAPKAAAQSTEDASSAGRLPGVAEAGLLDLEPAGFGDPPPADPAARLEEIRGEIGDCTRCKLHQGRTNIVFGVGSPRARLMFVGEGPGRDEDLQGEPFVGRAGKKLDEMIAAIGLKREEVYIANVVKCRPPDNRDPERDEIGTCSPFLAAQIECIRPAVIVTLGSPATKTLLNTRVGITRLRGNWQAYRGIPVMPTFHPAYVLRNYTQATRKAVWEDLRAAKSRIDETSR